MVFLALGITFTFVAEEIWIFNEHILLIDPYPSWADFFYLAAYPCYTLFLAYFLKPAYSFLNKKITFFAIGIALAFALPSIMLTYDLEMEGSNFEVLIALAYPLADSVLLIPAVLGYVFLFKGMRSYFWTLMLMGFALIVIADTMFLEAIISDTYYDGHPSDIFWLLAYVLFSFSLVSFIKNEKQKMKSKQYQDDFKTPSNPMMFINMLLPLAIISTITVTMMSFEKKNIT